MKQAAYKKQKCRTKKHRICVSGFVPSMSKEVNMSANKKHATYGSRCVSVYVKQESEVLFVVSHVQGSKNMQHLQA